MKPKRVLVAPLDWGLGHASRCVPLIDALQERGAEVLLAGNGGSLEMLKLRFPELEAFELPAYDVRYAEGRRQIPVLLRQLPRLSRVIRDERKWLQSAIHTYRIDAVISDNRYGLWSRSIPSVILCHQLRIQLPSSMRLLEGMLAQAHRYFLNRFDGCWVPDRPGPHNLSGRLTHMNSAQLACSYTGPLSRFLACGEVPVSFSYKELKDELPDMAAVLSGPEPQRSLLEEMLVEQAAGLDQTLWIIQGKPGKREIGRDGNITRISFMDSRDLHRLLTNTPLVISRPGYSSLMDFAALGLTQMILIPTPGQTEQQYLADRLSNQGIATSMSQHSFQLSEAIEAVKSTRGFTASNQYKGELLHTVVREWLEQL